LKQGINKKNKIVLIIFGICITIALSAGLYTYTIILRVKEDTTQDISLLNSTNAELADTILRLKENISSLNSTNAELADTILRLKENISSLNSTNMELKAKTDILEEQQQSLLQEDYDFLLFSKYNVTLAATKYYVKSGLTSNEEFETTKFSEALQYALDNGKVVIMPSGSYGLNSDVIFDSKSNVILDGQGAVLNLNGYAISFVSDNYDNNSNNQIRNFVVCNGTFKLENSFRATFENIIFEDCESAIEISNTNTWSEATKLENIYWENCQTALTFKTPTNNATGSYENTALDRCYINLFKDNSVGIMVEKDAQVSNSQWTNIRIWMHANETQSQTGLHLEGAMADTILSDVIFESFGNGTIYGIYLGQYSTTAFSLGSGTSFLGDGFEAKIKNPYDKWIYGDPSVLKENRELTFNESQIIHRYPLTIGSFDAFIKIENLGASEEVTVQIKLNFIDDTSNSISLHFSDNQTYWLTKDDFYKLYPSQSVICNIEAAAQTNLLDSQAKVSIGVMGSAR